MDVNDHPNFHIVLYVFALELLLTTMSANSMSRMTTVGPFAIVGAAVSIVALLMVVQYRRCTSRKTKNPYRPTFSPPWVVARSIKLSRQHTLEDLRGALRRLERALTHIKADLLGSDHWEKLMDLSHAIDNVAYRIVSFLHKLRDDDDESDTSPASSAKALLIKCREMKTQVSLLMVMRNNKEPGK